MSYGIGIVSFFAGFFIGLLTCVGLVYPIVYDVTKRAYGKVYDNAVNDTLERLARGNNKKNH